MPEPKSAELKRLRLRQMDERLAPWLELQRLAVPGRGWIRAIRGALGMGIYQFARRLGTKPPTALGLEKSEASGTITLNSLRRAAEAMECTLVYAVIPNKTLEAIIRGQALKKAHASHVRVSHSMALEAQGVNVDEGERQESELAQRLLIQWPRTLWDDPTFDGEDGEE